MNKYKLYMIFGIVLLGLSITGSLAYYKIGRASCRERVLRLV